MSDMKKMLFHTFFIYKMNKQNKQICILPNNHCWFQIRSINCSSSNKSISITLDCIACILTVFISAVSISRKYCLFLRFKKNSSFLILNTLFSVYSTGLPNFPFGHCRWVISLVDALPLYLSNTTQEFCP